jgi:hypothetical protein
MEYPPPNKSVFTLLLAFIVQHYISSNFGSDTVDII